MENYNYYYDHNRISLLTKGKDCKYHQYSWIYKIIANLKKTMHLENLHTVKVFIIKNTKYDPELNACADYSGYYNNDIMITENLLKDLTKPAITGVICHEMGHFKQELGNPRLSIRDNNIKRLNKDITRGSIYIDGFGLISCFSDLINGQIWLLPTSVTTVFIAIAILYISNLIFNKSLRHEESLADIIGTKYEPDPKDTEQAIIQLRKSTKGTFLDLLTLVMLLCDHPSFTHRLRIIKLVNVLK